jgi:CRP-like cAMP-binding protein
MFKVFDAKQLVDLNKMTTLVELDSEQVLFQQGQEFKYFYYVISGIIKLSSVSQDGSENVIEIMQKEHFFAESLMFINKPQYPVQASSIVKTALVAIDAKKYRALISQSESAMMQLLGDFSHRIHQLVKQIDDISFHSTKSRVASYILRCCDMHSSLTFSLDIPKNTIASRLSMKPETFSRALHFFDGKGIITVSKRTIEVHKQDQLIEFINKENQC